MTKTLLPKCVAGSSSRMAMLFTLFLAVLALDGYCATGTVPIHAARGRLEEAHTLIEGKASGGDKANLDRILTVLTQAENHLNDAKNNRGTDLPVALKFISGAKDEIQAAKDGAAVGPDHLQKADENIKNAIKRLNLALEIRHLRS